MDVAVIGVLDQNDDLSRPSASRAPNGICQAGPKNRPMSGCIKAMRTPAPREPKTDRLVGLKSEVFVGCRVDQFLQLCGDGGHLAQRPLCRDLVRYVD